MNCMLCSEHLLLASGNSVVAIKEHNTLHFFPNISKKALKEMETFKFKFLILNSTKKDDTFILLNCFEYVELHPSLLLSKHHFVRF